MAPGNLIRAKAADRKTIRPISTCRGNCSACDHPFPHQKPRSVLRTIFGNRNPRLALARNPDALCRKRSLTNPTDGKIPAILREEEEKRRHSAKNRDRGWQRLRQDYGKGDEEPLGQKNGFLATLQIASVTRKFFLNFL